MIELSVIAGRNLIFTQRQKGFDTSKRKAGDVVWAGPHVQYGGASFLFFYVLIWVIKYLTHRLVHHTVVTTVQIYKTWGKKFHL